MVYKEGVSKLELAEWKSSFTRLSEEKIKTLSHKYINIRSSTTTLKNDVVKRSCHSL